MIHIGVIVGSVRENRFAILPSKWVEARLSLRENVSAELLDLIDYPMPFFAERISPSRKQGPYSNSIVESWTARIASNHGFVIVTPEYNHSFPAALKNALDYVHREWASKPVAFVSYGTVGGARAVQQLRLVALELNMIPMSRAVHLPYEVQVAHREGTPVMPFLERFNQVADSMLDQLIEAVR